MSDRLTPKQNAFQRILKTQADIHGINREITVAWLNTNDMSAKFGPEIEVATSIEDFEFENGEALAGLANQVVKKLVRGIIAKYEKSL
jgi:hypothetical protein